MNEQFQSKPAFRRQNIMIGNIGGQSVAWGAIVVHNLQLVTIGKPKALDCRDYGCQSTTTAVQLIKVVTPNGRIYVLMTSLLDSQAYPAADFASLYHSRWRIEEGFKRLEHRLALENNLWAFLAGRATEFRSKNHRR